MTQQRFEGRKRFAIPNRRLVGPRWIIHFPTKKHWRNPSKLEWVRTGLRDLVRVIRDKQIQSVALPPLGCGNGGLDWELVKREIEAAASEVPDVNILVFALEGTNLEVQEAGVVLDRSIRDLRLEDPLRLEFVANKYGP